MALRQTDRGIIGSPLAVTLVFNYQYPGKYAFNVLAGAVESDPGCAEVTLLFPRSKAAVADAIRERRLAGDTVIAAWSFYSPGLAQAREELAWVRAQVNDPAVTFIAGGVHTSAEPETTLGAGFDWVCVGEGEHVLLEALRRAQAMLPLEGIRGLWRLEAGKVKSTGRAEGVKLDEFPPFAAKHNRFGAIEITRGCIYACRFCQTPFVNKARFRHRSVENVRHWAREMAKAELRDIRFISPTSLSYGSPDEEPRLDQVEAMLAAVREELGPHRRIYFGTFPSEVRPEHVTPEALALLKRYVNNDNLIIGGQSGSDRVLQSSHRGHDREAILRAARVSLEGGFLPNVDFIFGLPGETEEDIAQTVSVMRELSALGAKVHGHTFMPLPGTPFRNAPPGQVSASLAAQLDELASQGGVYGQWKKQAEVAQQVARERPVRER